MTLQIYYKMLKNHTTKEDFYLKSLKKVMLGEYYLKEFFLNMVYN